MAKDLQRAFKQYNRKYFNNELPDTDLYWRKIKGPVMGYCDGVDIVISENYRKLDTLWRMTLLHEMVHLKRMLWQHGPNFQNEMRRLANEGAFDHLW